LQADLAAGRTTSDALVKLTSIASVASIARDRACVRLLGLGYAFESASKARRAPKYLPTIDRIDRWSCR
jgi:hypothetical protein